VALADEHTGVVKGLGEVLLEHKGLQPSRHDVTDLNGKHVIQLALVLLEETQTHTTAEERVTLEDTLRVLLIESEKHTGVRTHLSEEEGHTPNLTFVLKTKLADNLHLIVEALLLERTPRRLRGLRICSNITQPQDRIAQNSTRQTTNQSAPCRQTVPSQLRWVQLCAKCVK